MRFAVVDNGVVVNIALAESGFAASQGWVHSEEAQIGWLYDGLTFSESARAPGTVDGVVAERERRLALGFDYDFGDSRGVHHIGTTKDDLEGWSEVTSASLAAIAIGRGEMGISIVTNTGSVSVTALEWQEIMLASAEFRQPIWLHSFAIQAMEDIPSDYTNDEYWT
jgi:hypothetical protein